MEDVDWRMAFRGKGAGCWRPVVGGFDTRTTGRWVLVWPCHIIGEGDVQQRRHWPGRLMNERLGGHAVSYGGAA
jgi:hypothetical protein